MLRGNPTKLFSLKGIRGFNSYFVGERLNVAGILNFDLANLNAVRIINSGKTAAVKGGVILVIKSLLGLGAVILLRKSVILNRKLITGGNLNLNLDLKVNVITAAGVILFLFIFV